MIIKPWVLAAGFICLAAGSAPAQTAGPSQGGGRMAACRDDVQKLCPDKHGPDRRACIQANKDKLSDRCKAAIAARAAARSQ